MNTTNNIEQRLWDYIDGLSTVEEQTVIQKLIADDAAWRAKYHELLDIHQLMDATDLDAPSMRFTKNVMEEISRIHIAPAAQSYINKNIIRGLAIFFITTVVGYIIYGIGMVNWADSSSGSGSGTGVNIELGSVDYSKFFNNTLVNGFMMINVILGLFLLDRYLANKRKKYREI